MLGVEWQERGADEEGAIFIIVYQCKSPLIVKPIYLTIWTYKLQMNLSSLKIWSLQPRAIFRENTSFTAISPLEGQGEGHTHLGRVSCLEQSCQSVPLSIPHR